LAEMHTRLRNLETGVTEETNAACCYAKSDKYWVNDPQGVAWETFHTLDSIPMFGEDLGGQTKDTACCIPVTKAAQKDVSSCCSPTSKEMSTKGGCC
ncbi:MAG TPA: glyoxalase/bleomycin resistance/dioxygenase family protein, partial [Burkholderiales bacterium]|nr:glyoxalase/bleomycin resistance/dioxygenase family protein [Burkholderiales bacterium]